MHRFLLLFKHCSVICAYALPPAVLSWSHSSADVRDLNTAAVKCQHAVILLMKLTILVSVVSWPTMDMSYSLSCPTVIPSLTVWENDRIKWHRWTKTHVLIPTTFEWECYTKIRISDLYRSFTIVPFLLLFIGYLHFVRVAVTGWSRAPAGNNTTRFL